MKQHSRLDQPQEFNYSPLLDDELAAAQSLSDDPELHQSIRQMLAYVQDKAYYLQTNELNSYFATMWDHIVATNPEIEAVVQEQMGARSDIIFEDLLENRLAIEHKLPMIPFDYESESKNSQINLLRQQSQTLKRKINKINHNLEGPKESQEGSETRLIYEQLYSQQKIKAAEEFVKKNREEQLKRKKKQQELRKKQEQEWAKKDNEMKQQQKEALKNRKQEAIKKQKQYHEKREKEKATREQRNTEYMRIRKSMQEKKPLYQKIYEGYSRRYDEENKEKEERMHSQRKHYWEQSDLRNLQKHQKEYSELLLKKQQQRKQRVSFLDEESRTKPRYHSSYELPPKTPDPRLVEKEQAKQKREKIKQYRAIVRQKFQPKIDDMKKKELMNLIEELEIGNRRVKKRKLQNGSILYEELRSVDPKMIGIQYLERVKEMAHKAKIQQKNNPDYGQAYQTEEPKKYINYLEQIKKNRTKNEKMAFVDKPNLSYEDKVKKVLQESDKLTEANKQNQMMLKFGKFKTSEQILACKQEIDQNYLDIVNMKLKLILNQNGQVEEGQ